MKSEGKRGAVAADLLVELFRGDAIKLCQVAIEHHLLISNQINFALDNLD